MQSQCIYTAQGSFVCPYQPEVPPRSYVVQESEETFVENVPKGAIMHPNGQMWNIDKDNNMILSTTPNIDLVLQRQDQIFNDMNGPYYAILDRKSDKYIRHSNFILHLSPFANNNYDFAWKLEKGTADNTFYIYNAYGSPSNKFYVGFDGKFVKIVESQNKVAWILAGETQFCLNALNSGKTCMYGNNGAKDGNKWCKEKKTSGCSEGWIRKDKQINTDCKTKVGKEMVYSCFGDTLYANNRLMKGDKLVSKDGKHTLIFQDDNNVVLYNNTTKQPTWDIAMWNPAAHMLIMQGDGNLVLYDSNNKPLWASGTDGKGVFPHRLVVQNDGNLVIYDKDNKATWATGTYDGRPRAI